MHLDETDQHLLFVLQKEMPADLTHEDLADRIGVSSSTVSNRLQRLRDDGILEDYQPQIDYERAGVPHHVLLVCTAPIADRQALAEKAIEVDGVVTVRELLTGTQNLHVELVCTTVRGLETATGRLDSFGLEIERSRMLRREFSSPCEHFDRNTATGSGDDP
ncbi:Lrp/AsnC family transcriptional regulator [Natrarchaeobaculum aegyptiacum]|uniref:HTH asnC-type domain-containing protein n=1 Tax=Natrarchaeobaculum aegyptiacum TaxID=745377 RepID=A0A2Z2HTW0_9EURY|nr:Lrp/AsnC family transcriptional regulator [Natrarchaeobaculum aegyptiacum]ARS90676.1 hypothetical protein B1756_13690 [Natrarchaeobaculum aegyptiacum]